MFITSWGEPEVIRNVTVVRSYGRTHRLLPFFGLAQARPIIDVFLHYCTSDVFQALEVSVIPMSL